MTWREAYLRAFGPGILGGITFRKWWSLLCENDFEVTASCLPRAVAITMQSLQNSFFSRFDERQFDGSLDQVTVPTPLFVLGHWRSGTTHLHNLLSVDERFAFPNNYQALFPSSFLAAEASHSKAVEFFLPPKRPMDNVQWTMKSPQEDEFALCILCAKSPCMGWIFPKQRDHYDRYLTFRGVPEAEIQEWQATLVRYLKKLMWKLKRPLILKSPPHTCRIKLLLQIFPDAKFVHIHRDPYTVFSSSKKTFQVSYELHRLQRPRLDDLDEWILGQYRRMYDVYFEERDLIPAGRFHEIGFEDLERDTIGEMSRLYRALELPDFEGVKEPLEKYVASIAGYQKNEFATIADGLRQEIAQQWKPSFDQWGYKENR
jgi:hypothetical protein